MSREKLVDQALHRTRRHFLHDCQMGIGGLALASLLRQDAAAAVDPLASRPPHYHAPARNVIFLHMAGSPPHLDLFDYKPELVKRDGQDCPSAYFEGKRFAFTSASPKLLGTPRRFRQHGDSGIWLSDALPKLATVADELCVIRSMNTDQFNHAPAQLMLYTGSPRMGRPSLGSWVTYGLGSENQNLPGFVVLVSSGSNPSAGKSVWGSGFLPSVFQGVQCRTKGDPVLYVSNPKGMDRRVRRMSLDALRSLNEMRAAERMDPETQTRIAQYELAYRMQASVPEVMDISSESQQTLEAYGAVPGESRLANNCLLARRLVEQGVRFVQLFDWGWDFHGTNPKEDIRDGLTKKCQTMDRPVAALIRDLKERGLLDETLVIFSGEFGRTPFREGRTSKGNVLGRDHFVERSVPENYYRKGDEHGEPNDFVVPADSPRRRIDVGTSLGYRGDDPNRFFSHAEETRLLFGSLFAGGIDPVAALYDGLRRIAGNRHVMVAQEKDGRRYGPAIIRAHYGDFTYAPHFDSVRLRESRTDYEVYRFEHQLAGVLVLQNAVAGNATAQCIIPHCLWEPEIDGELVAGNFHAYAQEHAIENCRVDLEPGDLYFFNTRCIHEVPGVAGQLPRIVVATFIGHSEHDPEVMVWS